MVENISENIKALPNFGSALYFKSLLASQGNYTRFCEGIFIGDVI
jgi:hypothetical protein